jgi:hypothetical protein
VRDRRGISQAAASVFALAATVMIVAVTLSMQLPNTVFVQRAAVREAGEAEQLAGAKLSLVALIDGRAIIANDGTAPVTLKKLFTESGAVELNPPITIQPGQKVSVLVGNPGALAAELEGTGSLRVVLKEKPGLQVATATYMTSCCVTTRYVLTRSTTIFVTSTTQYAASYYIITKTQFTTALTNSLSTIRQTLYKCIQIQAVDPACWSYGWSVTSTITMTSYYTPISYSLYTTTSWVTIAVSAVSTITSTTTSIDSQSQPWVVWYITYVTKVLPQVSTSTTTQTVTLTSPVFTQTTTTTWQSNLGKNYLYSTAVQTASAVTTTTTVTAVETTVSVS